MEVCVEVQIGFAVGVVIELRHQESCRVTIGVA
jgi:hypothetical protein